MKSKIEKQGKRGRATIRKVRRAARIANAPVTEVTLTFRHVEPTDAIRLYAERKFAHFGKLIKRTCQAHLILTVDKYRQHGEVTVKSGRLLVTAQEETKDLYSVIDLLEDKVGRQLKRHLGKLKTKKVRSPSTGEVLSASEEI
ncbi:ribosome hibernation-promoting factor, HPF/YfiA family [Candidatus Binatus sp.]|uniref:ribosome hibernation-promoting factor, HPF/YfiA family n=1 Tax=Candidatus Binatus sp. TaxID=2811406 RepID=UPI003C4444FF